MKIIFSSSFRLPVSCQVWSVLDPQQTLLWDLRADEVGSD